MSSFWHRLGHIGILALNGILLYGGLVPPKYAPLAVAAQGLAHAILAEVDRTPAPPSNIP